MISVGVDAHKQLHVAVAVDAGGRELCQWQGRNSRAGWQSFEQWLNELGPERQVGIEGAWGYGRGLAQHLVGNDERVFEVNARLTAAGRRRARRPDKTDQADARSVALCLHREGAQLPKVTADDDSALLELLSVEREQTLNEATRLRNQIHALLMQLDPEYKHWLGSLRTKRAQSALIEYKPSDDRPLSNERAMAVRRLAARLQLALSQVDEVGKRIRALAAERFEPLTDICGVNLLTAGALAGILGPGRRFENDAALAAYAGAAPLEASSAGQVRHRLNRGGNRRLNSVLYMIILSQIRHSEEARAYFERRLSEGKTKREAMRALKRFVARAVWHAWQRCEVGSQQGLDRLARPTLDT